MFYCNANSSTAHFDPLYAFIGFWEHALGLKLAYIWFLYTLNAIACHSVLINCHLKHWSSSGWSKLRYWVNWSILSSYILCWWSEKWIHIQNSMIPYLFFCWVGGRSSRYVHLHYICGLICEWILSTPAVLYDPLSPYGNGMFPKPAFQVIFRY